MKKIPNTETYVTKDSRFYRNGRQLSQYEDCRGYRRISLRFNDGTWKNVLSHRMVAIAYIDNPNRKPCVNHIDGNKKNNHVSNLEWVTYSENTQHAFDTGLQIMPTGEDVHNAKYSNSLIHSICKEMQEGRRNIDIYEKYSVPKHLLKNIRGGKSWCSISNGYKIPNRSRVLSDSTIKWICHQIEFGRSDADISREATNSRITRSCVNKIRRGVSYTDISENYNFNN